MTTPPPAPPPGWYPSGAAAEERWWDGQSWTVHARPVPLIAGADQTTPRTAGIRWTGSKDGSLIGAILLAIVAGFALLGTLLAVLSGTIMFLAPAFAVVTCAAFSIVLFLNYRGLSRNEATARAGQEP